MASQIDCKQPYIGRSYRQISKEKRKGLIEKNNTGDFQEHHRKLNNKTREERNPKAEETIGGKDLLFSVFYSKDQKVSKNIVHERKFQVATDH